MKRKIVIASLTVLALLALIPIAAWWYVFHTQAGVDLALSQLDRLQKTRITVTNATGTLAGPLTIERFELDEKHVNVVAEDIQLELTPLALLAQTVRVDAVSVARAKVRIKTYEDAPSTTPPRFFPSFLRLSVGRAQVSDVQVITAQGATIAASDAMGALTLTAQELEATDASVGAQGFSGAGQYTLYAKRPVEMRFVGTVRAPGGRDVELASRIDFSGTPQSFRAQGELTAPSPATFHATIERAEDGWLTRGEIASDAFALTPWIENAPFSLRNVKLAVTGVNADIRATGTVVVPELDAKPIAVDAQGRYADRVLHIAPVALRLSDSTFAVTAHGRIEFGHERPRIVAQAQWVDFEWPLRAGVFASPQGQLSVEGDMPYAVSAQGLAHIPGRISGAVSAAGELSNTALQLSSYTIAALDGEMRGRAELAFGAPQSWRVYARAANIDPAPLYEKLRGRLNFDVDARGTGLGRDASFSVDLQSLRGSLFGEQVTASGSLQRRSAVGADAWSAKNIVASLGENRLELDGEFGQRHNLTWLVDVQSLERFLDNAKGSIRTSGAVRGQRATPIVAAEVTGRNLEYGDWRAEALAVSADVNLATAENSRLVATAHRVGWREQRVAELRLTANGTTQSHAIELRAELPADNRAQLASFNVSANGAYANKRWRGIITPLQLVDAQSGAPTAQAADAQTHFAIDEASVQTWCVLWRDHKACIDGDWRSVGAWNLELQSDPMPLHMFDALLGGDSRLNGLWQLQASARAGRDAPWTATATLRMSDANLAYQPIEGAEEIVQLGSGRAEFRATAARYQASLALATPGTTSIDIDAHVERPQGDANLGDAPLTGSLRARTSDANLLPLLLVDLDRAAGNLRVDLEARGTLGSPSVFGDIELARGELDLYRYNLALRDMNVAARIDDNRVRFNGDGRAGDGELSVEGDLRWRDDDAVGTMRVRGERLLVADLPDYRVVASPDVRFAIDGRRIDVSGNVTIPSASIQPTDLRGAVQRSPDVRLINEPPRDADRGFAVYSNIEVRIGDDVNVDSYGLTGKLGGAVTAMTRPNETPRGRGELRIGGGHYEAYGQELEIERGRLLFDAAPLDNPGLDILAIRRVEDQRVGVNVRGTLRAPRLTLYADPSLPQTQIVAYLLTGKAVEDMRSSDTAAVGNATDALALQGGSLLASQLGRRVGLEQVSVESNGFDDTSLVLGKFLSPRLFISYGISLTESFNTLKARYTISDHWLLKTEAGQHQSADVEFRIER